MTTRVLHSPRPLTPGIHAATTLPFLPDGRIDEASYHRQLMHILPHAGLTGLLVNGHAGENQLTSDAEKEQVVVMARAACDARGAPGAVVVSGVYSESTALAAAQAKGLERAGADALLVFPPFAWSSGPEADSVLTHHRAIAGASALPLMLYQSPVGAGRLAYGDALIADLIAQGQVAGIKDGSWEIVRSERLRNAVKAVTPEVLVYGSGDEHLLVNYLIGTEGSQVSLAAVIPAQICALWTAASAGDWDRARSLHEKIQPLAHLIYAAQPGSRAVARLKACQKILGLIADPRVRAPLMAAPAEEYPALEAALAVALS